MSDKCSCGGRFLDGEDFRDHLPCPGSVEERLYAALVERDRARADARLLAHAYTTDNTPPQSVVSRALQYPKIGVK